jgi:hypothetical protein
MEKSKKEVQVFTVGTKEFFTEAEAELYELELKERLLYTYYRITHSPDLTEGRGYYSTMVVAVKAGWVKNALTHYLCNKLGQPVVKVMGYSPMDNWLTSAGEKFTDMEELEKFLNHQILNGIGDYRKKETPKVVYINDEGTEVSTSFSN